MHNEKYFLGAIIILCLAAVGHSQIVPYNEAKFSQLKPVWYHTSIDSSLYDGVNFDGMGQLTVSFPFGKAANNPFVTEDKLVSITPSKRLASTDIEGGLIEVIDLNTGLVIWNKAIDLRTEEREHHIENYYINDSGDLEVILCKRITAPGEVLPFRFTLGIDSTKMGIRTYDLETGELLSILDPAIDAQAHTINSDAAYYRTRIIPFSNGETFGHTQLIADEVNNRGFEGYKYIRAELLDNGSLSLPEKHLRVEYPEYIDSTWISEDERFKMFHLSEDTLVTLETATRLQDSSVYVQMAILNKDLEYSNIIDLSDVIPFFTDLRLVIADRNFVHIIGQIPETLLPGNVETCGFYYIFDYEGTMIANYDLKDSELASAAGFLRFTYLEEEKEFLAVSRSNSGNSINFYKTKNLTDWKLIKTITPEDEDAVLNVYKVIQIDNGDLLINMSHSLRENNSPALQHWRVWARIDGSELGLSTSTNEKREEGNLTMELSPNPVNHNHLGIDFGKNFSGNIQIYDFRGIILSDIDILNVKLKSLAVSNLLPGQYLLKATDIQGDTCIKRFTKF